MPAAICNITIEAGTTFRLPVIWKDGAEVPVDLTGYTAQAQVRADYAGKPLLTFDSHNDSIELSEDGEISLLATPAETRAIQNVVAKSGVWDLELTSAAGEVTRLLEGKARFSKEVTR